MRLASLVSGVVALALLVPALRWAFADRFQATNPEAALALVGTHPGAIESLAVRHLEAGDLAEAKRLARKAIRLRPLESRAYRILAAAYEREGRIADATAAHRAAVAVSPSNVPSRLWLASCDLQRGDFDSALGHLDHALRAEPARQSDVFPPLLSGLGNPAFDGALIDRLGARPPWRSAWLAAVAESAPLPLALEYFDALAPGAGLTDAEARAWLERLARERRWDLYARFWQMGSKAHPMRSNPWLVDGEFEEASSGYGRDWQIGRAPGATITLSTGSGRRNGGRALTIRFANQRVPFRHVGQLLLLPPGRYELVGEVRLDDLRAARGLRWQVVCIDGPAGILGRTPALKGRQDWTTWRVPIDVPEDCPAQRIELALEAIGPSEELVGGTVRFDGLRIEARTSG
jgi:hypothetical protein